MPTRIGLHNPFSSDNISRRKSILILTFSLFPETLRLNVAAVVWIGDMKKTGKFSDLKDK